MLRDERFTYLCTCTNSYTYTLVFSFSLSPSLPLSLQDEYSSMRDLYMRTGQGFILVYSITSPSSYDDLEEFRNQILRAKDADHVPMILVGNKADLEAERGVTTEKAKERATAWECEFMESSARTRQNINEIFHNIVRQIRKFEESNPTDGGGDKGKAKKKKKKGCTLL
eukprot:TRINITY_DN2313_c0_g1_i2.p1 TRINITY_DN2313_c0_g1~~TRINITY_DN2313_c0_g1_i2.p1  ORF type:complete len:169 (+),score=32.88 TRINITY_DN2313_c0_g1_i2:721-1227(+)